jgi:hypothetical protein
MRHAAQRAGEQPAWTCSRRQSCAAPAASRFTLDQTACKSRHVHADVNCTAQLQSAETPKQLCPDDLFSFFLFVIIRHPAGP